MVDRWVVSRTRSLGAFQLLFCSSSPLPHRGEVDDSRGELEVMWGYVLRARSPPSLTRSLQDACRCIALAPPPTSLNTSTGSCRGGSTHAPHHRTAPYVARVRSGHLSTPSVALPACVLYPAATALHVARRYSSVRSENRPLPQRRHRYAQYARGHLFASGSVSFPHPPSSPRRSPRQSAGAP
jgi:hypothetical protein